MATAKKRIGWYGILVFVGGMILVMGFLQMGFRLSHAAKIRKLERDGTRIEAVIKEKERVAQSRHRGQKPSSRTHVLWIRYLPAGAEDTKDNLIWEDVSQPDFNRFKVGQTIHVLILDDDHYITERSGFHSNVPDWAFLAVGAVVIAIGMLGRKSNRRSRDSTP